MGGETVSWFKDSQVTPDAVHLAKHRVQKMLDETMDCLRDGKMLELMRNPKLPANHAKRPAVG
jgi:hypothetical protein